MSTRWGIHAVTFSFLLAFGASMGQAQAQPQNPAPKPTPTAARQAAPSPTPASSTVPPAKPDKPPLKQAELDQLLASIALYPDPVLSQVLMASTYPLEIVEADRWAKKNANLKGDALAAALEKEPWDPSVKSLVNFPDVLSTMSNEIGWTAKLGDAVLEQQEEVMATVQSLRKKAKDQGTLQSNEQQVVTTETGEDEQQVIEIEPATSQVIYVPTYDPALVYGAWWYPDYPPYFYPYGYYGWGPGLYFGWGFGVGPAWGYAWGHFDWGHHRHHDHHDHHDGHHHGRGHIDVDSHRNVNVNRHIDRTRAAHRSVDGRATAWRHDPSHRGAAPYRNTSTARRFGAVPNGRALDARASVRNRANVGRREIAAGRVDRSLRSPAGAADRSRSMGTNGLGRRDNTTSGARSLTPSSPRASSSQRGDSRRPSSTFSRRGVNRGTPSTGARDPGSFRTSPRATSSRSFRNPRLGNPGQWSRSGSRAIGGGRAGSRAMSGVRSSGGSRAVGGGRSMGGARAGGGGHSRGGGGRR